MNADKLVEWIISQRKNHPDRTDIRIGLDDATLAICSPDDSWQYDKKDRDTIDIHDGTEKTCSPQN